MSSTLASSYLVAIWYLNTNKKINKIPEFVKSFIKDLSNKSEIPLKDLKVSN